MAGALVSTVSAMLKERYLGPLQTQLNNEILVTQILGLDSKSVDLDGLKAVVPLHYGRSTGIGARLEDEDLPAAGNQSYKRAEYDLAYLYGRARFTGQAVQKTKTDAGAFIRAATEELDRLRDDLALDTARQYYGDGSGAIGVIATGASNATQTLTSDEVLQKGYLYPGMRVDIGTTADVDASANSATVLDVDVANKQVTFTASVSTTTNDIITREDNAVNTDGTKEINAGLSKLVSSGNSVGGISGGTYSFWNSIVDSSGGAISLDNLMLNWNKVAAAGAKPSDIKALTTPGIARRLFATSEFKNNVRFVNSEKMAGGFSSISFNAGAGDVTLITDRLAPYGKVFFVNAKHIKVYSPGDWDFLQRDGLTIRWVDNKDAFQAVLFKYVNLGTNRRNNSLVMSGITDTGF